MKSKTDYEKQWNWYHEIPDSQKSYWAGILDGEGCLRVADYGKNNAPRVTLKMTCQKTIKSFAKQFDGVFKKVNRYKGFKDHWKDQYVTQINGHKAAKLLEVLWPFMITKQQLAKDLSVFYIQSCEYCESPFWKVSRGKYCSDKCRREVYNKKRRETRKSS